MDVLDVGVVDVLHRRTPVAGPSGVAGKHDRPRVEELFGHVFLDGRGFPVSHPYEHDALEHPRQIDRGPCVRLSGDTGVGALAQHGNAFAGLVEGPAVVSAGDGALPPAVGHVQHRAPVGARVMEGHDAVLTPPEDYVVAQQLHQGRFATHLPLGDAGVPILPQAQLGDQAAPVRRAETIAAVVAGRSVLRFHRGSA